MSIDNITQKMEEYIEKTKDIGLTAAIVERKFLLKYNVGEHQRKDAEELIKHLKKYSKGDFEKIPYKIRDYIEFQKQAHENLSEEELIKKMIDNSQENYNKSINIEKRWKLELNFLEAIQKGERPKNWEEKPKWGRIDVSYAALYGHIVGNAGVIGYFIAKELGFNSTKELINQIKKGEISKEKLESLIQHQVIKSDEDLLWLAMKRKIEGYDIATNPFLDKNKI